MEKEVKRYMDVGELAGYLGISKWMIYKYIQQREIPFIPYGRIIRFDRAAIDRWTQTRTVRSFTPARARRQAAVFPAPFVDGSR
ncbi:MAG: helix-turn-helix domain-containing protein [Elusimicrobiota bacterium]